MGRLTRKHMYFNSHPHEEDDIMYTCFRRERDISTHILTRRMTGLRGATPPCVGISTHILTRRMTAFLNNLVIQLIFQLTSSRGG